MTNEFVKAIEDYADDHDIKFLDDYSGRCMYGATCVAMITDTPLADIAGLAVYMVKDADLDSYEVECLMDQVRQDNMGLRFVVYWPDLQRDKEDAA